MCLMNMISFSYYSNLWQLGLIFTKQICKFQRKISNLIVDKIFIKACIVYCYFQQFTMFGIAFIS